MSKKLTNAQGEEFTLNNDSFSFVQSNKKIFDQKFDTKPTTFFKDAIRRFCKNKSSVVGAVIIAVIILLSIFVPIFSPHDISYSHTSEKQMKPKLFEAGTGFWDGTEKVTGVAGEFDEETNSWWPIGVNRKAVSKVVHYVDKDGVNLVDYVYDGYEDVYGLKTGEISQSEHQKYVRNGWLDLNVEEVTVTKGDADVEIEIRPSLSGKDKISIVSISPKNLPEGVRLDSIYNTERVVESSESIVTAAPVEMRSDGNYWPVGISSAYVENVTNVRDDENGNKIADYTKIEYKYYLTYTYAEVDYTILNEEKCPIKEITYAKYTSYEGIRILKLYGTYSKYMTLGYDKAPRFLFGTDDLGRDSVTRCFSGMGQSLLFALAIMVICFSFGLVWGAISGYFGGNVDLLMERFMDILGGVPTVVIVTLFRLHLGDKLWVFVLALCLTGWMGTASRTRTQFYRFKGREYVLASRTLGSKDIRLIFRHVLPNALGTIVTSAALMLPGLIFTESSLAYLGLGLQGGSSFGSIIAHNQQFLKNDPALVLFPAVIISLLMISFNLFGNGLRDALNPSLKGSE